MVKNINMEVNDTVNSNGNNKVKRKKIMLVIVISFVVVLFLLSLIYFLIPRIYLKGSENLKLEYGKIYKEPGYTAKFINTDITNKVSVKGNVNASVLGTYKIKYTIQKNKIKISKTRIVQVIDSKKPEIELIGGSDVNVCPSKTYNEEGYTAIDNYDGDITQKVKIEQQDDKILYNVSDSSGNKTEVIRNINKVDKDSPKITISGLKDYYILKGYKYSEPGYKADDNCDGDISKNVKVTGTVDHNKIGEYTITYEVSDNQGNVATASRIVHVANSIKTNDEKKGSIYLTFDDGPSSSITPKLLDILKSKGVKATFFVINHSNDLDYLIKREHNEGHTVALHSYTHNYKTVYSSVDGYFNDLNLISNKVEKLTGVKSMIIRFPGGSSNTISRNYNKGIMKTLTNEVLARGYHYFDWNVSSGDAGGAKTKNDVYKNVVNGLTKNKANIVLMHDFENNNKTLDAISDIIDYGKKNGYEFLAIDLTTQMVKHPVNN